MTIYTVEIPGDEPRLWTEHSSWISYRDAVDQADLVHGRLLIGNPERRMTDKGAYQWAFAENGFEGTYQDWREQSNEEREEFEDAAAGIPTF